MPRSRSTVSLSNSRRSDHVGNLGSGPRHAGADGHDRCTEWPLVADGTLTQAQADAVVSTLIEARPEGPGRGGEGRGRSGPSLDAAATALGLSVEDLRAQLRDGSTLAEIATVQGVDVATVVDALVAEATTRLNEAVTAGRLTQEEADAKLVDIEARITEFVNEGGHRDGHRGGGQLKD
jgi:hypothetical protein